MFRRAVHPFLLFNGSHPLFPLCTTLLILQNTLLQQQCQTTHSLALHKLTFKLLSTFTITLTNLHNRYCEGKPPLPSQTITEDSIDAYMKDCWDDCCPRCGAHIQPTQSLCRRCSECSEEKEKSVVEGKCVVEEKEKSMMEEKENVKEEEKEKNVMEEEKEKNVKEEKDNTSNTETDADREVEERQQLLRLLNVACYSHDGTLWRACRATYLLQWESFDHADKKRRTTATLPSLSQTLSVAALSTPQPQTPLPSAFSARLLTRAIIAHSPAMKSVPHTLAFLLSFLHHPSTRFQLAALSSLHSLLANAPSLFSQPSILRSLASMLRSPFPSTLAHTLDILLLQPRTALAHFPLYRSAALVALKQDSKAVRVKALRLLSAVLHLLLQHQPQYSQQALQLLQCCVKHTVTESDPIIKQHGHRCLQLLWSPHTPALLPLQQALITLLQENRHSLVPQDSALYDELCAALAQPPIVASIGSFIDSTFTQYAQTRQEVHLRVLHCLLEVGAPRCDAVCAMIDALLPEETEESGTAAVWALKDVAALLKKAGNVMENQVEVQKANEEEKKEGGMENQKEEQVQKKDTNVKNQNDNQPQNQLTDRLETYQKRVARRLKETDSVEGIEACVQCLCLMAERMDKIGEISDILDECIDTLEKEKEEKEQLRSVTIMGCVYEGMNRSLYMQLLHTNCNRAGRAQFESAAGLCVPLFSNTHSPLSIQYYALRAFLQCVLHNPGAINAPELLQILDMMKPDHAERAVIAVRCVFEFIKRVPAVLESPASSFPQTTTPVAVAAGRTNHH